MTNKLNGLSLSYPKLGFPTKKKSCSIFDHRESKAINAYVYLNCKIFDVILANRHNCCSPVRQEYAKYIHRPIVGLNFGVETFAMTPFFRTDVTFTKLGP